MMTRAKLHEIGRGLWDNLKHKMLFQVLGFVCWRAALFGSFVFKFDFWQPWVLQPCAPDSQNEIPKP